MTNEWSFRMAAYYMRCAERSARDAAREITRAWRWSATEDGAEAARCGRRDLADIVESVRDARTFLDDATREK